MNTFRNKYQYIKLSPWDHVQFKNEYNNIKKINDEYEKNKRKTELLRMVAINNYDAFRDYIIERRINVTTKYNIKNVKLTHNFQLNKGEIIFEKSTIPDAVVKYNSSGSNVNNILVIHYIDSVNLGGKYITGGETEECEIYRQFAGLYYSLNNIDANDKLYPIQSDEFLYTPGIKKVRNGIESGYKLIKNSNISCSFVSIDIKDNENTDLIESILKFGGKLNYNVLIFNDHGLSLDLCNKYRYYYEKLILLYNI